MNICRMASSLAFERRAFEARTSEHRSAIKHTFGNKYRYIIAWGKSQPHFAAMLDSSDTSTFDQLVETWIMADGDTDDEAVMWSRLFTTQPDLLTYIKMLRIHNKIIPKPVALPIVQ
jgi:hypothetical protein